MRPSLFPTFEPIDTKPPSLQIKKLDPFHFPLSLLFFPTSEESGLLETAFGYCFNNTLIRNLEDLILPSPRDYENAKTNIIRTALTELITKRETWRRKVKRLEAAMASAQQKEKLDYRNRILAARAQVNHCIRKEKRFISIYNTALDSLKANSTNRTGLTVRVVRDFRHSPPETPSPLRREASMTDTTEPNVTKHP